MVRDVPFNRCKQTALVSTAGNIDTGKIVAAFTDFEVEERYRLSRADLVYNSLCFSFYTD